MWTPGGHLFLLLFFTPFFYILYLFAYFSGASCLFPLCFLVFSSPSGHLRSNICGHIYSTYPLLFHLASLSFSFLVASFFLHSPPHFLVHLLFHTHSLLPYYRGSTRTHPRSHLTPHPFLYSLPPLLLFPSYFLLLLLLSVTLPSLPPPLHLFFLFLSDPIYLFLFYCRFINAVLLFSFSLPLFLLSYTPLQADGLLVFSFLLLFLLLLPLPADGPCLIASPRSSSSTQTTVLAIITLQSIMLLVI